ncbi:uncharacterized protein TNCV_1677411 [Trichonephila clavipes]|nr:uncharacterized protein TNCV_1677411 [Trichonephila clavipes]
MGILKLVKGYGKYLNVRDDFVEKKEASVVRGIGLLTGRPGFDARCLQMPSDVLVKSLSPKFLWAESRVQVTGGYFPPLQSHDKIVEVEISGVAIYRPFGESRRASSYCHLYGAQSPGQCQA